MLATTTGDPVAIPLPTLPEVRDLYERGLYVQAYRRGEEAFGPLRTWAGTDARVMAGRLAMQLGDMRLGRRLHSAAWRQDRTHPEACYYRASALLERRGPLAA